MSTPALWVQAWVRVWGCGREAAMGRKPSLAPAEAAHSVVRACSWSPRVGAVPEPGLDLYRFL